MLHALKIRSLYFREVRNRNKLFEIRINDRNYRIKDILLLEEIDEKGNYTGNKMLVEITYICDYLQSDNVVVLGIK